MHNIAMQEMKPVFRRALEKMHIIKRKQEPAPSEKPKLPEEAQKKLNDELISAAEQDNNEEIGRLIKKGASIEAKDNYGWTALMRAAREGYTDVCMLLVEKGASIEAKSNDGRTALIYAAIWGHTPTCALLLEHNASIKAEDKEHKTASSIAKKYGNKETAAFLKSIEKLQISVGADVVKNFLKSFGECLAG